MKMFNASPAKRVSLNMQEGLLCMDDLFPQTVMLDMTKEVNIRLFQDIPKGPQVIKTSACIIGGQGCGKSILVKSLTKVAFDKYGPEKVHVLYADDIRVLIEMLDDKPVQLLIIDDAMTNASSREVFKQIDIIKIYNQSRHVYEDALQGKPGIIIFIWAWQRFGELDPAFRQGDVMIFKTGIAEPSEKRLIEGFLGKYCTEYLWRIWDKINRGNNAVKSVSVARIPSLNMHQGAGKYISQNVDLPDFPKMIKGEDYFNAEEENVSLLDKYRDKPEWAKRIRCYDLHMQGDKTQLEIATELGIKRQGYVSESIKKVKDLLRSK